jgi:hypothetical protein
VADVAFEHQLERFIDGRARRNGHDRGGHHLFHPGLGRIPSFQDDTEHDVPFTEDAFNGTVAVDYHNAANLGARHRLDGVENCSGPGNGYDGPALNSHVSSFLSLSRSQVIKECNPSWEEITAL